MSALDIGSSRSGLQESIVDGFNQMDALYAEKDAKLLRDIDKARKKVLEIEESRELTQPPTKWEERVKLFNQGALFSAAAACVIQLVENCLEVQARNGDLIATIAALNPFGLLVSSGTLPLLSVVNASLEYSGAWDKLESLIIDQTGWSEDYVKVTLKTVRIALSFGLGFGTLYSGRRGLFNFKENFSKLFSPALGSKDLLEKLQGALSSTAGFFTSITSISRTKQTFDMSMHKAKDLKRQKELEKWTEKLTGATKKLIRYQNDRSRHFRGASGLLRN